MNESKFVNGQSIFSDEVGDCQVKIVFCETPSMHLKQRVLDILSTAQEKRLQSLVSQAMTMQTNEAIMPLQV